DKAYAQAVGLKDRPTLIVAKTEKGHGVSFTANKEGWHGKAMTPDQAKEAIKELGGESKLVVKPAKPADQKPEKFAASGKFQCPTYDKPISTREAYGDALKALGAARGEVVALDAEVGNSTYSEKFGHAYPERFF